MGWLGMWDNPELLAVSGSQVWNHISSQPMSTLSPRGMTSRDSCLTHDTQNSWGVPQETFLKVYLLEVNHPQHSSRIQRIWHGLLTDWGQLVQAKLRNREKDWKKNRRIVQYQLLSLPERCDLEPLISYRRNLLSKLYDGKSEKTDLGTAFRYKFPDSLDFPVFRKSISRPKYALTQDVLQTQCYGSKK